MRELVQRSTNKKQRSTPSAFRLCATTKTTACATAPTTGRLHLPRSRGLMSAWEYLTLRVVRLPYESWESAGEENISGARGPCHRYFLLIRSLVRLVHRRLYYHVATGFRLLKGQPAVGWKSTSEANLNFQLGGSMPLWSDAHGHLLLQTIEHPIAQKAPSWRRRGAARTGSEEVPTGLG